MNAAVLVLGDLNRSPRMLNHAKAISNSYNKNINQISLIGYNGGDLRSDILTDKKIKPYYINLTFLTTLFNKLPRFLFILTAIIKVIIQMFYLTYILFTIPRPSFLILQNPPGIPSIFICSLVCFIRRTVFVLDWHNYGYTILKANKRNNLLVYVAYLYEYFLARTSHVNLCVSNAMKKDLEKLNVYDCIELPDRALPGVFNNGRLEEEKTNKLFTKYKEVFNFIDNNNNTNKTNNKPMIFLSSTSWTPDEDFNILLDSFIKCEELITKNNLKLNNNKILFIITGRGPMKEQFFNKVNKANLKYFDIRSIWLDSDDYPKILSCVDIGVCLHKSSSGFDLPMKVVDMFSAGLPVLAIKYETIGELVIDNHNGYLFNDSDDLSIKMYDLIVEYYNVNNKEKTCKNLEKFRLNLHNEFSKNDWISQWDNKMYKRITNECELQRLYK